MAEAGLHRADDVAEVEVDGTGLELPADAVGQVRDALRPRRDLTDIRRADSRLSLPRMRTPDVHPARMHPGDAGPRQHRVSLRLPLPVGEHLEPVGARAQRVCLPLRKMDEDVVRAYLVDLAVLPGDPRAGQDEEDLLFRAFGVSGRRPLAGIHLDPLEAHLDAPSCSAEVVPRAGDVAGFAATGLDVVPVRDVVHDWS